MLDTLYLSETSIFLLWLTHVRIEVIEISQFLGPETRIRVGRIVTLVVLDVHKHIVLLCCRKEVLVVFECLHCRLCDENVDAALNRVLSNWVVGGVRSKNGDCVRISDFPFAFFTCNKHLLALPFGSASMAVLYASGSVLPSLGYSSKDTSRPLYASEMFFCKCSPMHHEHSRPMRDKARDSRIAGNLPPETPTIESFPTFPRLRRSNRVRPTTPTFLSDLEAPPPTNPVVYSPVPTWNFCQFPELQM